MRWIALLALVPCLSGCSSSSTTSLPPPNDDTYRQKITTGMHDAIQGDLEALVQATTDLQAAAPAPQGHGWDPEADADAIAKMKAAWLRARTAYEHIEGALAPIFPDIDASIDARYDDFLSNLGVAGDANLFDDQGVTGLHAIERILYVDVTPGAVVDFESKLPGYVPAAIPANEQQATDFRTKLCAKAIADATSLRDQWQPSKIDLGGAFQGLISLMNEQREKVNKASTGEEESRYSQRTMADIRDNLQGTKPIYALFVPWLTAKSGGAEIDHKIQAGLDSLGQIYAHYPGDTIPRPPGTWSAVSPTPADLSTPFGELYSSVRDAVDPGRDGSIVFEMNAAATALGFPEFTEAP